jgi:hypothetical protein
VNAVPLFKVGVSRRSVPRGIVKTADCVIGSVVAILVFFLFPSVGTIWD